MKYQDFRDDVNLTDAAALYTAKHGGSFFGDEPGGGLVYETEDGEIVCTPPEGEDAAQILRDLQNGKPLPEVWPEQKFDPDNAY